LKIIYICLEEPGSLVNHSCNPNSGIKFDKNLIAIKNIKKDEQVFYDYSTAMDEDSFTMQCDCRKPDCRKTVKDFKYLPADVRKKYLKLGIVQKFIAKIIQNTLTILAAATNQKL